MLYLAVLAGYVWGEEEKKSCSIEIFGLIPNYGEPSTPANLYGKNFSSKMKLGIGNKNIPFNFLDRENITFQVPNFSPGSYPLNLSLTKGCQSNEVTMKISEIRPVISALIPDQIYYCTTAEDRKVFLKGDHFFKDTKIIFDGLVVGSSLINTNEIEIKIPQAKAGLHRIHAVNPAGTTSMAYNFYIEGRSVIYSVKVGIIYQNHYELLIEGENFLWGSVPLINGERIEKGVTYKGCNLLVYDRAIEAGEPRDMTIQVETPDGNKSDLYYLSIP